MTKEEKDKVQEPAAAEAEDDDEPDEWEKRIFSTGCAGTANTPTAGKKILTGFATDENMKMTDCYYEKKDWRACKDEMEAFRQCWKQHNNDERTSMKDA
ncbi:uncharacterized protein BCR38DRAFT_34735 [Pseudomassariella vexata]|uniref:CHCH domain-containing protein n=1 Tax=Pseudomassariella vexata TaxID=1141098 RepID=A0A1Y2DQL9_9PEZI|nr:uncharacterized protein BCR38DRAFT_34735 [Pseudomassariella vexata]ORY61434.1 hypothetical protein BCR38DRAFT_34735 [Pseudomassariella vexata]